MKSVKISELKANLAKFLRMVRGGETIEVLDRGRPIAVIRGTEKVDELRTIPPLKDPSGLAKLKSQVEHPPKLDVVQLLLEDRRR